MQVPPAKRKEYVRMLPNNLPVYNNCDLLKLTDEELAHAQKIINQIVSSMSFFRQRLGKSPAMDDVHTHMGLFESYFSELAPIVGYDSVLAAEHEHRFAEIREKNAEIHRLTQMLGQGISPEGISAKLREYDDVIRCFYGALGFRYASLEEITAWGPVYRFTPELEYDQDDGNTSKKEWVKQFQSAFSLITVDNTEWDICCDTCHAELLDTDANKYRIMDLLADSFPNHQLREFRSRHNDFGTYSLEFTVYLAFRDIEDLRLAVLGN